MKFFYQENTCRFQLEAETPDDCFKLGQLTLILKGSETSMTRITDQTAKLVLSGRIEDLIVAATKAPAK